MRSSICAQSWLSVPPAPAWTSRKVSNESASPASNASSSRRAASDLQFRKRLLGFGNDRLILLGFAEFDHADLIFEFLLDPADRLELILERIALLHHLGGALRIVPERGVFGELIQFGEAGIGCIEVKDASSAARPTA